MDRQPPALSATGFRRLLLDPFNIAAWAAQFGDDIHLRIGATPPVIGKQRAVDQLDTFMNRTGGFATGYCDVWRRREALVAETDLVLFARGGERLVPCALFARVQKSLIRDLRLYVDLAVPDAG